VTPLVGLAAAPTALAATGTVAVTGPTLTVSAAPGSKDNLEISRPTQSRLQVSDFPSGVHSGGPIHAGPSCAQTGTKQVSCVATGVKRIEVSAGDLPDRVVNSTGIPSALDGGAANDILIGGSAPDTLTGGPAPDVLKGLGGNDQLLLHDGISDESIDCGAGAADFAVLDRLPLDPNTTVKGCESKERGRPGPYVALGDSLSIGFSASSPAKGYVGLLDSGYQSSLGVNQLLDVGQAGASTTTLRDNGQLADALSDINAPSDTKAVTIDIGGADAFFGNECPGHWDEPNTCPARANLAYIFGQLKTALAGDPGNEPFIAMAYYNPASGKGGSTEPSYDRTLLGTNHAIGCSDAGAKVGLDDVIYQEAGKVGIPVADAYPAFKQHGQAYMSATDSLHVHPNDAGYAAIAQAFGSPGRLCG
jgi:lysophospholipase L1-like esterase